jgi:cytochrome c
MQFKHTMATALLALVGACGGPDADNDGSAQHTAGTVAGGGEASPGSAVTQGSPPPAFVQCRSCHAVEPGRNGLGPTLFGIVGRKAGEVPGYNSSPALARSGIVWDRASLDTWLAAPMEMVPGTRMVVGQPDPEKRKAIIDYLETLK